MTLQCPNCRTSVTFWRAIRTTAFNSFTCQACGSILGISVARRFLAVGVWLVMLILLLETLGLHKLGRHFTYPTMLVSLPVLLCLFERIVLIERRAFTCRSCGYDLQGLPDSRCPECGATFDPAERQEIRKRQGVSPPGWRNIWLAALLLLLLTLSVVAGLLMYRRAEERGSGLIKCQRHFTATSTLQRARCREVALTFDET